MRSGLRCYVNLTRLLILAPMYLVAGCTAQHPGTTAATAQAPDAKTPDAAAVLALKMRRAEFGKRYADDLAKAGERIGNSPIDPRFAYNLELNTCVVRAGYLNHGELYVLIADSLTGERLVEMFGNDPRKQAEFNQAEIRLMGPPESEIIGKSPRPR